ncbi:MAG: carbonic anhydrase [Flammeovirgaceae bacterium]|nr:carbonic anhydrase [Flammeovirgaceae bacterium]HCX21783.1 carbonic anhydrase [Cytophagales bacterium]|tara:strand:+ start:2010 stop:2582 length:573 start_codon:yes stop_codon:yes gene_type:complete
MTPKEALDKLKEGNARYVSGNLTHPNMNAVRRDELNEGQNPFAVVLSCADSRVVPECVFDQGMGDLFVLRVAGNIAGDRVIGSIEYAVENLGCRLIVVLGHEKCGAVSATLGENDPGGHMSYLVEHIKPAVERAKGMEGDLLTNSVKMNAKLEAEQLAAKDPYISKRVQDLGVQIVPAYYKLSNGEVEFM